LEKVNNAKEDEQNANQLLIKEPELEGDCDGLSSKIERL